MLSESLWYVPRQIWQNLISCFYDSQCMYDDVTVNIEVEVLEYDIHSFSYRVSHWYLQVT